MPLPDNFPVLLFAVLVIIAAGAVVFYAVMREPQRFSRLERLAYSYALGLVALSLPMFLASWAGYHIRVLPVLVGIALAAGIAYSIRRAPFVILWQQNPQAKPAERFTEFEWMLLLVIVGTLAVRTLTSLIIPLNDGDGHAIWGLKAKVLFYETVGTTDYFHRRELAFSNMSYPLLVPFMYAWVCTVAGHWDDMGMFIVNPVNLVMFAVLLYATLRRFAARPVALAVTAMFATLPALMHYAECAQADVPLMLISGASLFLLWDWMQNRRTDSIVAAGILMAGALFTKQEGKIILPAHLLAATLSILIAAPPATRKRCFLQLAGYTALAIGLVLPWFLFQRGVPDYHSGVGKMGLSTIRWGEIPVLCDSIIRTALGFHNAAGLPKWNLLWVLMVGALLVSWKRIKVYPWHCLLAAWLIHACGVSAVFLAASTELKFPANEVGFERYTLIMLPPLWLLLGLGLDHLWQIWKSPAAD